MQTPTLELIYRREQAIKNHTSQKYYRLKVHGEIDRAESLELEFKPSKALLAGDDKVFDKELLEKIADKYKYYTIGGQTSYKSEQELPPLPYNTTKLNADMNKRYKMRAKDVQDITQRLREKYHAISYNRADTEYLPENMFYESKEIIDHVIANLGCNYDLDLNIQSRCFDDKGVTAHHAIIPQAIDVDTSKMTDAELKVYTAICDRFLMQFMRPEKSLVATTRFEVPEGVFIHTYKKVEHAGWKGQIKAASEQSKQDEELSNKVLLEEDTHKLTISSTELLEAQTKPPLPYTEGSLILDMSRISKYVKDPEIKRVLLKKDEGKRGESGGIGTSATRADIIANLKTHGFIAESKGKIVTTELGQAFIERIPQELKSADTTARWWLMQQDILEGKLDEYAILNAFAKEFLARKDNVYQGVVITNTAKVIGTCPICGKNVVDKGTKSKKYQCESNRYQLKDGIWEKIEGCGFSLPKVYAEGKINPTDAKKLLEGKSTSSISFVSKSKKHFKASLRLDRDGKINFEFTNSQKTAGKHTN